MRKAITAPLPMPSNNTSHPFWDHPSIAKPSLLCLPYPTPVEDKKDNNVGKSESFWRKLATQKDISDEVLEDQTQEQDLSTDDDCQPSENESTDRIMFSEKFEEYLKGRMRLRDMLDPHLINSLLKVVFNVIIGIIIFLLAGYVILTLREDLMKKKAYEMELIMVEINQCTKEYFDNRCPLPTRLAPIQDFCVEKEKCMLQDPMMVVQGTKLTSALLAEALNEFINPLGWKTISVLLIAFFGSIYVVNHSLGNSYSAQDFRGTPEYDDLISRLQRTERFSMQKERFCIQNARNGKKFKVM